jgi:hypothetical protein
MLGFEPTEQTNTPVPRIFHRTKIVTTVERDSVRLHLENECLMPRVLDSQEAAERESKPTTGTTKFNSDSKTLIK